MTRYQSNRKEIDQEWIELDLMVLKYFRKLHCIQTWLFYYLCIYYINIKMHHIIRIHYDYVGQHTTYFCKGKTITILEYELLYNIGNWRNAWLTNTNKIYDTIIRNLDYAWDIMPDFIYFSLYWRYNIILNMQDIVFNITILTIKLYWMNHFIDAVTILRISLYWISPYWRYHCIKHHHSEDKAVLYITLLMI